MAPSEESRILERLAEHEREDAERLGRIEGVLQRVGSKLDTLSGESSRRHLALMQKLGEHGATLALHSHRITGTEREVEELRQFEETTGRHEIDRVKEAAAKLEREALAAEEEQKLIRRNRIEWVMRIVIGIALMLTSMLAGWLLPRC